jgi:hypothetical protein
MAIPLSSAATRAGRFWLAPCGRTPAGSSAALRLLGIERLFLRSRALQLTPQGCAVGTAIYEADHRLLDDLSAIHGGYYNHLFQVLNMNYVDAW